jgi:predicted secreted protein
MLLSMDVGGVSMETLVINGEASNPVVLRVGEELVVELEENGTTGFEWEARPDADDVIKVKRSEFVAAPSGQPGAAGRRRFVLSADRPGRAMLSLHLRRSWEASRPPRQTRTIEVVVEPS